MIGIPIESIMASFNREILSCTDGSPRLEFREIVLLVGMLLELLVRGECSLEKV